MQLNGRVVFCCHRIGPAAGANIRGISDNHYGNDNDLRGLLDLSIVFTLMQLCTRGVKHGLQTYKIRCKPISFALEIRKV